MPSLPMNQEVKCLNQECEGQADHEMTYQSYLGINWRPTLAVIGLQGLPSELAKAGNVVHKDIKVRMSMRTAPTHKATELEVLIKQALLEAPLSVTKGAKITVDNFDLADGFCAPNLPQEVD